MKVTEAHDLIKKYVTNFGTKHMTDEERPNWIAWLSEQELATCDKALDKLIDNYTGYRVPKLAEMKAAVRGFNLMKEGTCKVAGATQDEMAEDSKRSKLAVDYLASHPDVEEHFKKYLEALPLCGFVMECWWTMKYASPIIVGYAVTYCEELKKRAQQRKEAAQ